MTEMQLFDRMCAITERFMPDLVPLLRDAVPIQLDITPHKTLRKTLSMEELEHINAHFQLPAPVIAIEDRAGCTFLIDPIPNQIGINHPRHFIDVLALDDPLVHLQVQDELSAEDRVAVQEIVSAMPKGSCSITMGSLHQCLWQPSEVLVQCQLDWVMVASETEEMVTRCEASILTLAMRNALTQQSATNAQSAMEEVLLMKSPARIYFKTVPDHEIYVRPGRIARSRQRILYRSIDGSEAEAFFGIPTTTPLNALKGQLYGCDRRAYQVDPAFKL